MGKSWDQFGGPTGRDNTTHSERGGAMHAGKYDFSRNHEFQLQMTEWATGALRILKPGGHLLAFGGTRTYHRLACAVEDAGFEIRDSLIWLYGSGFPKSRNGEWGGTALKPGHEPIVMGRKPLDGTVAANFERYGTGALNIDACKVGFQSEADEREAKEKNRHADFGSGARENRIYGEDNRARGEHGNYDATGRWPANVVLDEAAAEELDRQSGELAAGNHPARRSSRPDEKVYGSGWSAGTEGERIPLDTGGASRFFYCAKASRSERNAGCDSFEKKPMRWSSGEQNPGSFQAEGTEKAARNPHPTVKPVSLMHWLCRLVTPEGGTILDPFVGSGTTGCAAVLEGFDFVGIEREAEYVEIANARIEWWAQHEGREAEEVLAISRASESQRERLGAMGQMGLLG
jgi:site-specific DNA-methyltransferase (adenine-specific)